MTRTVDDSPIETLLSRADLEPRKKPYWKLLKGGGHLGYYKGSRGGSWVARVFNNGKYQERKIGRADDEREANGGDVLSFQQACEVALDWFGSYKNNHNQDAPRRVASDPFEAKDRETHDWLQREIKFIISTLDNSSIEQNVWRLRLAGWEMIARADELERDAQAATFLPVPGWLSSDAGA